MTSQKIEQAALNNAVWCDTVCRSHGCPGEFRDALWVNSQTSPPFYPNAATLGGVGMASVHQSCVSDLIQTGMPTGWSIKDSFQTLDLAASGFSLLFKAHWIYKAATPIAETRFPGVTWEVVTNASDLIQWEQAWSGEAGMTGIFLPELLRHKDVAIIAARREGHIVAGLVANRAAECVGVSNLFVPAEEAPEFRSNCIVSAQSAFPDLPLVGYEFGSDLSAMQSVGFAVIGGLSVWVSEPERPESSA